MIFPPGVTAWERDKTKSEWREFAFMLHMIQQAIEPNLSLKKVISGWNELSSALAESSRMRRLQVSRYTFS